MTVTFSPNSIPAHKNSSQGLRPSLSNRAFRNVAFPWSLPIAHDGSADLVRTTGPTQFSLGTLASAAPTAGGTMDIGEAAGARFTDDLTDINDAGAADVLMMPAAEAIGDQLVLGFSKSGGVPVGINVSLSTAGVGGTMLVKYLSSLTGEWTTFPYYVDNSVDLTAGTSTYEINWQVPDDFAPVAEDEIDAVERYYVALEVLTTYATNPVGTQILGRCLAPGNISLAPQAPSNGLIDYLSWRGTADGTGDDVILQICNWTRGTRGYVTIPQTIAKGRVAFTKPLYVARGDEITVQMVQDDGTTEILNFDEFVLEIAL